MEIHQEDEVKEKKSEAWETKVNFSNSNYKVAYNATETEHEESQKKAEDDLSKFINNEDLKSETEEKKEHMKYIHIPDDPNEMVKDFNTMSLLEHDRFIGRFDQENNKIIFDNKHNTSFLIDTDDKNYNDPKTEIQERLWTYISGNSYRPRYDKEKIYFSDADWKVNVDEHWVKRILLTKFAIDPQEYKSYMKDYKTWL